MAGPRKKIELGEDKVPKIAVGICEKEEEGGTSVLKILEQWEWEKRSKFRIGPDGDLFVDQAKPHPIVSQKMKNGWRQ